MDEIRPNLTEYLHAVLMFSYFLAPYATPATVIAAVPTPIAGSKPKDTHQEHGDDHEPRRREREARDRDGHDRQLRPLRDPHDPPLRPYRRQAIRERRTEKVGQHERTGRHAHRD